MPLPSTRTIPRGWSQHHTGAAAGGMNATVTVGAPGERRHDPVSDDTVQAVDPVYTGPARIEEMNQARVAEWVGQDVSGQGYLVQLEYRATTVRPGMLLDVLSAPNDPQLVRRLYVHGVRLGSERFTRDLVCSDTAPFVAPDGNEAP